MSFSNLVIQLSNDVNSLLWDYIDADTVFTIFRSRGANPYFSRIWHKRLKNYGIHAGNAYLEFSKEIKSVTRRENLEKAKTMLLAGAVSVDHIYVNYAITASLIFNDEILALILGDLGADFRKGLSGIYGQPGICRKENPVLIAMKHSTSKILDYVLSLRQISMENVISKCVESKNETALLLLSKHSRLGKGMEALKKAVDCGNLRFCTIILNETDVFENASEIAQYALKRTEHFPFFSNFLNLLLERKFEINSYFKSLTLLGFAIEQGLASEILNLLISLGASAERVDVFGNSALHIAAASAKPEIVKFFLKKNDVNCRNSYGETPLISLSERSAMIPRFAEKHQEELLSCIQLLLKAGANREAYRDYDRKAPLEILPKEPYTERFRTALLRLS